MKLPKKVLLTNPFSSSNEQNTLAKITPCNSRNLKDRDESENTEKHLCNNKKNPLSYRAKLLHDRMCFSSVARADTCAEQLLLDAPEKNQ